MKYVTDELFDLQKDVMKRVKEDNLTVLDINCCQVFYCPSTKTISAKLSIKVSPKDGEPFEIKTEASKSLGLYYNMEEL